MSNDIDVKIGADVGELGHGMDKAAETVRSKSNQINDILRKNAQEAVDIARKQAAEMEAQARKQSEAIVRATKEGADRVANIGRDLQNRIVGMFSMGAIVGFVSSTKQAVIEAEQSFRGLEAVANYTGVGIGNAMKAAGQLAADGLMTTAEASKALQNLLSRGYSLDQAINALNRLKDAAAYNRQASLELGEAVVSATEGLKNENSILVDNAGVTKNVAKMWEEYAKQHGLAVANMTTAQKIQAEYNGLMAETEAQVGNAAKAARGLQGEQARLKASVNNLKISVGQALTPAFIALAKVGTFVIENFAKPVLWGFHAIGISAGTLAVRIGILWDAIKTGNFSGVGAKLKAEAANYRAALLDAAAAIDAPMQQFQASPDSGKRKAPEALMPGKTAGGKGKSRAEKTDEPVDVFGNRSFIASKDTANFIREQFEAVNSLQGEIAADAQRNARMALDAYEKAAQARAQAEIIEARATIAARMSVVDADEQAARHRVDLGLATREQLLAQEMEFEQRRHQIRLDGLAQQAAIIDPHNDPEAYATLKAEIEAVERQHQMTMTSIKNAAELERSQYAIGAMNSIQTSLAQSMHQLMMGQLTLANFFRQVWSGVLSAITGELAKFAAKWVMEKVKMLVFGKTAAMSEIAAASAKAGANGVASWAAAPWPINMGAPAFGAAMAAAAAAYAPAASFAVGAWELPSDMVAQVHKGETILPRTFAEEFRENGGSLGGGTGSPININIQALDARSVRDLFMDHGHHLAAAIRDQIRGFNT